MTETSVDLARGIPVYPLIRSTVVSPRSIKLWHCRSSRTDGLFTHESVMTQMVTIVVQAFIYVQAGKELLIDKFNQCIFSLYESLETLLFTAIHRLVGFTNPPFMTPSRDIFIFIGLLLIVL